FTSPHPTPATTELYTLSLHDALPIYRQTWPQRLASFHFRRRSPLCRGCLYVRKQTVSASAPWYVPKSIQICDCVPSHLSLFWGLDRKSTRLNSSHVSISYAVFCFKKK